MQHFKQLYFSKEDQKRAEAVHPTVRSAREAMEALDSRFQADIKTALDDFKSHDKIGVLLSGGVDSSLLVAMLTTITNKEIICFTAMTKDDDSDVVPSEQIAKLYGVKWVKCYIRKQDLDERLPPLLKLSKGGLYDTAANLATDACLRRAKELGVGSLWTGNGLDMFFGGGVDPAMLKASTDEQFHGAFWRHASELLTSRFYEQNGDEINELASNYGIKIVMPFETIDTILLARSIPAKLLFHREQDKYPVRLLAHKYDIPLGLSRRKKQPLQDSSGVFDLLRDYMYDTLPLIINDAVNFKLTKQYFVSNPNTDLQLFLTLLAHQNDTLSGK